ncbi:MULTISPECIES: hypothetical protein [Bacillus]|uniref:Uncharacterized protein n=3 Tax=Bacillus TaxID=1386 RepID=Q9X3Z0_BACIU|nr:MULTISPECIES: hypothetical protein [Bacillus]AAD22615.1 unknown [Bacillus subtilis]KIN32250.1 hypothetical protein B4069_4283 [Bacillus subtilis]KIN34276.1 hypothetical protein B4068_4203 [Bacillus subtilis]KIN45734.1 hypothetical protein B4072_4298 [Bacillus subtilis]KIN55415.1 hypothetical protein B4073_4240 [Bacillus subtilis]
MKKIVFIMTTLILVFSLSPYSGNGNVAVAEEKTSDEKIVNEANDIAEKYGFETVPEEKISTKNTLNFNSVEEFEKFLKEESAKDKALNADKNVVKEVSENPVMFLAASKAKTTTKTYSYKEYNGTGYIGSYARVKRTGGKVKSVNVWSEQNGFIFGITWTQRTTWYNLNAKKTGGKAYVRGTKLYGMNVVGQPVGYSKSVTYTVKF